MNNLYRALFFFIVFIFSPTDYSMANTSGERVTKPSFYLQYPLGTIAWIPRARTEEQAKNLRIYKVLDENNCYELPRKSQYWFSINHREQPKWGTKGFFSIRLLYEMSNAKDDLHIYRNKGWVDESGAELPKLEKLPDALTLNASKFVELHDVQNKNLDEVRVLRNEVNQNTDGLHAFLPKANIDSWKHAYLIGKSILTNSNDEIGRLSVRHIRYTVTAKRNSEHPVIFDFSSHNANSVTILIDSPGLLGAGNRIRKTIKFGNNKC